MSAKLKCVGFALLLVAAVWMVAIPAGAQDPARFAASAVDLEIVPAELERFLAALRENGAASIKEPGCLRYDILQSATNPNQIFIYEVYESEAAVRAHRTTDHFKKYFAATKDMMIKRQSRPMIAVASYVK